ncbi:MAG: hypothetical protein J7621_14275 [Niastella sp.]|nr:hypothetical protein [Niastella sp.]
MNLDRYEFSVGRNFLDFEFCSEGPNGKIVKVIRFTPQNANGITYFSLGFGDVNEEANRIDDQSISNNQDRTKILATVAYAVLEFTSYFTDVMIHAKGSTPARTRLYQMGIPPILMKFKLYYMFMDLSTGSGNHLKRILTMKLS